MHSHLKPVQYVSFKSGMHVPNKRYNYIFYVLRPHIVPFNKVYQKVRNSGKELDSSC